MPRIQDQVAENRRNVQRIDGRFVFVPDRRESNLTFGRNEFDMTIESIAVYTRPLNDTLVSGHPDGATHGSGQGISGDHRGEWTLVEDALADQSWTMDGRNAVRDSLAGDVGSINDIGVGVGSGSPSPDETALVAEGGRTFAYGLRAGEAHNAVRARANFLYAETGDGGLDPVEFGLFDSSGRLLGRATTNPVTVGTDSEVRVDLTVSAEGDGNATSATTDEGETAVAESLQLESQTVGLNEVAWGTGETEPQESDTTLGNEVYRATCQRVKDRGVITATAPQFENQPTGQPYDYTEVGVFDNAGRLIWRTTMDPYEKDDSVRFTTSIGFRIK